MMLRRALAVLGGAVSAVAVTAVVPAVSVADAAADAAAGDRLVMQGCVDASLLLTIEHSRAAVVVPAGYTVSATAGQAFLYVSTMRCDAVSIDAERPAPGVLQLVSVGVAAPGSTGGAPPPIGPGRRDGYLLAALTDHPGLLRSARRAGLPAVAGSATFSVVTNDPLLRHLQAAVPDGPAPISVTGDVTDAGSPVHQHELHYWHDDGTLRAHMELDIEMVDRPGVGRWESPAGSLVALLADRTSASTPLFLNSNEVSGALSSQRR